MTATHHQPHMVPYTMEEQAASGAKIFKRNTVYRSFRKTTEKAFSNIKKKVSDIQEETRQRKALRTLNESFDSPGLKQRKVIRHRPYRSSDMARMKASTPDTPSNSHYRNNPAGFCATPGLSGSLNDTPNSAPDVSFSMDPKFEYKTGGGRLEPIRRSMRQLKSKALGLSTAGGLKLQTTPESTSRRWVSGRPSKVEARRRIEEMASPKRYRMYSPGKIQLEVNELAKGLEDLDALAAKLAPNRSA